MSKENDYIMETSESSEQNQLNEIYYNCTECPSPIEILSINETECTIEFKCINNNYFYDWCLNLFLKNVYLN